jgi:signal transduction histidine kinase
MKNGIGDTAFFRMARSAGSLPFFASLRVRLMLLVLLALLPALGLIIYTALEQRRLGITAAEDETLRMVRLAATTQDQLIDSAKQLLGTLAQLKIVHENDTEACRSIFTNILKEHPVYADVGVVRPDGQVLASALPLTNDVQLGEHSYFQIATNTRAFAIGEYHYDRNTKRSTVHLAYPAIAPDGELRAVLYAALDLAWLYGLMTNAHLPPNSSMTVSGPNRITLVRYPDPRYIGEQLPPSTRPRPPSQAPERTRIAQSRDGTWRLYASTRLGHADTNAVSISVGIPLSVAYGPANAMLRRNLLSLTVAALLAAAASWFGGDIFVLRRVRSLLNATRRLSTGDLGARTGVTTGTGELHQLAHAFDEMAGSLQQRVAERERAQSELKKLNEELEQRVADRTLDLKRSNEDLEQFAYVASHDLQEPLRMVTNYLQLLQERYKGRLDQNADDFIGFAREGAERMQVLITDLLQYSRVGTKPKEFRPAETDKVLKDSLSNLKVAIDETRAKITHDPLPIVVGDPIQLTQLFQNLIGNAIKFHGEQPPAIHVSAAQKDGVWEFSVRDNGIGIAAKDFERIFIIFQRLHARKKYAGTGIGLAVCKKIVERHGGRIWVASEPGKGTTFYFSIPAKAESA